MTVKCEHLIDPMSTGHDERRRINKARLLSPTIQEEVEPFLVQSPVDSHHLHQRGEGPAK
jgi:hypothetical protein